MIIIVALTSVILVALIAILSFGFNFQISDQVRVGDLFAGASVFTAILLGTVGFRRARAAEKRAHTSELVSETVSNPALTNSLFEVVRIINRGYLPEDGSDKNGVRISTETDEHLMRVLNYYQFLAVSWKKGDTDELVLYESRGTSIIRTYNVSEDYINERRNRLEDDSIYRTLEELVCKCQEIRQDREREQ
jgi:Domain of unknown function (DUF4760)